MSGTRPLLLPHLPAIAGSVLLIVMVFVFILLAFGSEVVRHMLSQRSQTHRLEQMRFTENLAQALAVLALQKLAQEETTAVKAALSAPLSARPLKIYLVCREGGQPLQPLGLQPGEK